MVVSILVLEEALSIKSFSVNQRFELFLNMGNVLFISIIWLFLAIERLGSSIIERDINRSLKVLLGEYLINEVTEFSPADMSSGLWCLESISKASEFGSRKNDLAHV